MLQQSNPALNANGSAEESKESIFGLMAMANGQQPQAAAAMDAASAVANIGVNQVGISSDSNFLIIDLRDKAEYDAWHIKESYSLPLMMIN